MFGISGTEFLIIVVFVLVIFGPDKLPQIGRTVGQFMREFKRAQESMEAIIRAEVYASENKANPANTADVEGAEIFDDPAEESGDAESGESADTADTPEGADAVDTPESTDAVDRPERKSPFDNVAPEPKPADEEDGT